MSENKQCNKCYKTKPLSEFYNKKRSKVRKDGTVHSWVGKYASCKKCTDNVNFENKDKYESYYKEYRKANKQKQSQKSKDHYIKTNLEWVEFIKSKTTLACSKCGYDKTWAGLDFHHKDPREKENTIHSIMKSGKLTEERLNLMLAELEKCIVLCATCHREEHMKYNWLDLNSIKR
jgi:hypothetical protein